ncbi:MAG: aldose 1-epimerase [Aestuariibaculum sp.]
MYNIKHRKNSWGNVIELSNSNQSNNAVIALNLGASLQELKIKGKQIIKPLEPLPYSSTYASSILFPFANRIKNGTYTFNGNTYSFEINEPDNNNALHGLVYNKTFVVEKENITEFSATVKLRYSEQQLSKGFPFTYSIELEYVLKENDLNLNVTVTNTYNKPFPFTLGWHPYFSSSNLYKSTLNFISNEQLVFNDRCITIDTTKVTNTSNFEIKDKQLDDCFILKNNKVQFNTPDYKLLIGISSEESFLQIYTPPKENTIAIEPTTGVSDSFNNKMGLQILNPNKSHQINWNLRLI